MGTSIDGEFKPLVSIFILSSCVLAYEILLMRLFSIIQWHHYAYMIISLSLLGYGISGTIISLFQSSFIKYYRYLYPMTLFLFTISGFVCFMIAQKIPFNAQQIIWDLNQTYYLITIFLLLCIPFIMASSAICMAFIKYPSHINLLYCSDLIGAGVGCLLVIGLLFVFFPTTTLTVISILSILSVAYSLIELRLIQVYPLKVKSRAKLILLLLIFTLAFIAYFGSTLKLTISPYKELQQMLQIKGTKIISEKSSPLGLLTVIKSTVIPIRHAPGLSLFNRQEPLNQLGLFIDSDNMTAISNYKNKTKSLSYLDQTTSALAFHLNKVNNTLIIGLGGGADLLQALYHNLKKITIIELDPLIIELLKTDYSHFSGNLLKKPNVHIVNGDARAFLTNNTTRFDLISLSLIDSFNASSAGLYALQEGYLYTVEALNLYLENISANGYLSITRWVKSPPRDTLKLVATAIKALQHGKSHTVGNKIILIRSWQTSTLLLKKTPFSDKEIKKVIEFCKKRGFDLAWYPGIKFFETNRYNKFELPYFYLATKQLLSKKRDSFFKNYKYQLRPATDDKPFFHHFFKWKLLPELIKTRTQGGLVLVEMGYLILIITLIIAIVSSMILIALPLFFIHYKTKCEPSHQKHAILNQSLKIKFKIIGYFFLIGLAFLFIEIAFMQKFIVFLHHPIISIPVILTTFLVFAGIGSGMTHQLRKHITNHELFNYAIAAITFINILYLFGLSTLFSATSSLPITIKMMMSIIIVSPLALFMGMPLPLAMNTLQKTVKEYIPWAWGINGCASVISAVLATILAIHLGFNRVIIIAIFFYLCCIFLFPNDTNR
jgi:Spermine/spermidine synthase domain